MDDQVITRTYGNADLPEGTPERPLVTFALFAYNQEKYIREAVEGAFSQTYEPLELILSDDCSSDRTFEIMQEMAANYEGPHQIIVRQNNKNMGLAGHLNQVISVARGEIISWAAGDDVSLPERTSELCRPLLELPEVVGSHSSVQEIDTKGNAIKVRRRSEVDRNFDVRALAVQPRSMTTQSHAFRKSAFDRFGEFRADLMHEGYAMTFREASIGRIIYIEEPLTKYRVGSGVSTYSGRELRLLKVSEPVKISLWHYTASLQMQDDIDSQPNLFDSKIKSAVQRNVLLFRNLLSINSGKAWLIPLLHNGFLMPGDLRSLRAVLRRFAPAAIYRIAKRATD